MVAIKPRMNYAHARQLLNQVNVSEMQSTTTTSLNALIVNHVFAYVLLNIAITLDFYHLSSKTPIKYASM